MWIVLRHAAIQNIHTQRSKLQRHKGEYKKRLNILVCANWDGASEFSFLVTGLPKQTHYLKNMKCLPSTYSSNKAAWMMCEIFCELQLSLDRRTASKKNKILLFVNHCPAHPTDVGNFKNTQVVSHSYKHDISFATYASGYHQGLEKEVALF
jgi:hypothetical protein